MSPLDDGWLKAAVRSTHVRLGRSRKIWVGALSGGPRRFSELRIPLRTVTAKALTKSLRTLERDGLVVRAGQPVRYSLTPLGRSLLEPMDAACAWAREHWEELLDAREAS